MKRLLAFLCAAVLLTGTGTAAAAGRNTRQCGAPSDTVCATEQNRCGSQTNSLRNGDDICDNRQNGNGSFTDENGDGICDNRQNGNGSFTDEDGDGICDNRGAGRGCKGNGGKNHCR